ncbi:unnamed protein product [Rotaria sordida]|uniref:DDE-1 domain-containing protein n=1 Tax=Rotaria sordida TaxID=392033 RepID=A0A815TG36_9BILA|nr:unnamed protein product [Rotaria sordida]CAF4184562.1 unnamed protein product [Rotaria sordida]
MPRKYVRKTIPKYSIDDINRALSDIKKKTLTIIDAARDYNIPIATLYSRLSGLRGNSNRGRRTILSNDEEQFLVYVIELFQEWQQPLSRKDVIDMARTYMIELGKNISPNAHLTEWFHSFMTRWNDRLKIATSMKLERIRSQSCTKEVATKWFEHLRAVLTKLKLFNKPASIWNVDESGFFDDPGRRQVVVKRSTRYPVASQSGSGKSMTTVLLCTSAAGRFLPPYIVYKATHLYDAWCPKNGYPGARYNVSSTGWTDGEIFNDWFIHHFIPHVKNEKRPILLVMDGYKSHISTTIIKKALDHNIHIECLPPHSTTLLQPLDVVTLSKLKTAWRQLLKTYNQKTNSTAIDKPQFALLISELFKNSLLPSHCISGFLKSGIYPYDPRVISKEKLLQPPTATTSSSNQPVCGSNSSEDPSSSFNNSSSNTCHPIDRPSSCPNILLNEQNSTNNNIFLTKSNSIMDSTTSTSLPNSSINISTGSIVANSAIQTSTTTCDMFSNCLTSFPSKDIADDMLINSTNISITNTSNIATIVVDDDCTLDDEVEEKTYTGDHSFANNMSIVTSASMSYIPAPPTILSNTNSSISFSEVPGGNHHSLSFDQNEKVTNQSVLNAITTAINNHMSPMITTNNNNKRKRVIERRYGESLTSVDALYKIQEKENKRKKQKTNSKQSTSKSKITTNKRAVSSRKKKNQNKQQTFDDIGEEDSNMDQDVNQDEMTSSTAVAMINHSYTSHNNFQSPFQNSSISNPTCLQSQANQYSSYNVNLVNQPQTIASTDHQWMYWQYPTMNNYYSSTHNFTNL